MKRPGQIALTPFPHTDLSGTKLHPVLLLRRTSRRFEDWLICMVSSRLHQAEPDLDEMILPSEPDFAVSGLKVPSVLRLSRLAVLDGAAHRLHRSHRDGPPDPNPPTAWTVAQHSLRYAPGASWLDVYHINYNAPTGHLDDLYIKLKLDRDCVVVILASFHRRRL